MGRRPRLSLPALLGPSPGVATNGIVATLITPLHSSSKIRISVSCSRAALVALPASSASSSSVQRPSFGRGWTSRSYSNDVSPDRSTLRTVFRDTFRSRAISLIVLPLRKCSRRIRPIVSTVSIPPPPALNQSRQRISPNGRGSILDADPPAQGVKIARRITPVAWRSMCAWTWNGRSAFCAARLTIQLKLSVVNGPPRSLTNTNGDFCISRRSLRSTRNSSPRMGCVLGLPFLTR